MEFCFFCFFPLQTKLHGEDCKLFCVVKFFFFFNTNFLSVLSPLPRFPSFITFSLFSFLYSPFFSVLLSLSLLPFYLSHSFPPTLLFCPSLTPFLSQILSFCLHCCTIKFREQSHSSQPSRVFLLSAVRISAQVN